MPEPQNPRYGQPVSKAGSAPPVQGQAQQQEQGVQELDPAVLAAFFDDDAGAGGDGDADADADADTDQAGTLSQLAQHFSFVLIPFLFAIVTFLLAFLFLIVRGAGFRSLPTTELLAIGLIALAMAVLQGMMLYYSGSHSGLWFFSLLVGFVLFPPVLFFALDGAVASLITLGIMIVICGVIALICKEFVQDYHVGVVFSFGNYRRTLPPGPHFLPPWEHITQTFDIREQQWTCPQQRVHMSPKEDLVLAGTIAYEVIPEEAHLVAQSVNNWEKQLQERFCAILQNVATAFTPEDFYPWQSGSANRPHPPSGNDTNAGQQKENTSSWSRMNARLLQEMREQVAPGVHIKWTTIHDVIPLPHVDHMDAVRAGTGATRTAGTASTAANSAPSSHPGTTRAAPTPSQRQSNSAATDARTTQPPPSATPAVQTQAGTATNKKYEALFKTYDLVRNETITDPETIRRLARSFEAIAQDPIARQNFPVDAARAASNLYARAKYYEDQISASAEFAYSDEYDDDVDIAENLGEETQFDWRHQPPPADDLTGGG